MTQEQDEALTVMMDLDKAITATLKNFRKFPERRSYYAMRAALRIAKAYALGEPYGKDLCMVAEELMCLIHHVSYRSHEHKSNLNLISAFSSMAHK